jgi:hypothetical protein
MTPFYPFMNISRIIAANLTFDDKPTRGGQDGPWQGDRFAAMRYKYLLCSPRSVLYMQVLFVDPRPTRLYKFLRNRL